MGQVSGRHAEPMASRHGETRACLFGPLDIFVGGVSVTPLTSKRGRSLLGYLLLHRDTAQSREALAFLLWPDSSEDQARTNLRNLLHTLRRAVPAIEGCLSITNRTVQWRPETRVWVDAHEFMLATEAAGRAAPGSDEMVDALRTAVSLYHGDLLEDCYDDWIAGYRQRLLDSYVSALRRLTAALGDRGEYAEAVRLGRELVRSEPVEEENHRLLMRLHEAAGDRAAAVRAFHECAAVLGRELGIAPGATTRRLHEAIVRAGDVAPAADIAPAVAPATIVGRAQEWAELTRRWQEAEAGQAQLVVVTGEPGVGKTRLIEELTAWCGQREAVVCRARSYLTEGELGWGAVAAWLRTADVAARVRRSTPSDATHLARIVPELSPTVATTADERIPADRADGAGGGERRRVFDAAARAIMSTGKAVLLVADDAQWCDATSLQFVHYLLRENLAAPLLVVASARREDIHDRHPLTALLDGLTVLGRTSEIPLHRLTSDDTAALVSQLLGRQLDSAAVGDIYAETEGNPLFVVETVRAGAGGSSAGHTGTPPRLQAVIRTRLAQLSEPAHDLLDLAATVGREFQADLIRHALGVDDITVASGLDELWRRGLIREHDVDAYDFSHGKIRDVAYDTLGPASRRANHLRVAEGLQRFATDAARASGQIAAHYDRAGRTDEAVVWYREAARQAQKMSAYAEAVRFLERASELLGAHSTPDALARRLEVVSALPTAVIGLEGFASDRLAEVQLRAVEMAARLGVDPDPPVLRSLVLSSLCRDAFEEARAAAQRLHTSAEARGDHGLLVEGRYLLGVVAFWSGNLRPARDHFEAVVERFAPEDHDAHVLRFGQNPMVVCLSRLANTLAFLGFDDDARDARDGALTLADEVGHPYSRDVALVFAALLALDLDDDDGVKAYAARLATRADHGGPLRINAAAWPAYAEVLDGRAAAGIAGIRAALALCGDRNPAPGFRATLYRVLVAAHVAANDPHGGLAATEEALAAAGTRIWEPEARRARATFLAAVGDHAGAAAELDRAERVARHTGSLGPLRRIAATRVRLCPTG